MADRFRKRRRVLMSGDGIPQTTVPMPSARKFTPSRVTGYRVEALAKRVRVIEKRTERHYTLLATTATPTNAIPVVTLLNGSIRGDTVQNRTGDCTTLGKGFLKFEIYQPTTSPVPIHRIVVVMDREPAKLALTATNVFGVSNPTFRTLYDINNKAFWKRFKILADWAEVHPVPPVNVPGVGVGNTFWQRPHLGELKWDCKNAIANLAGGTFGDYRDFTANSISAIFITDSATAPTWYFECVQYFTE